VRETAQSFKVPKNLLHNRLTGIINRSEKELMLALCSFGNTFSQEAQSQLVRRVTEPDVYLLPSKGRIPLNWHDLTKDMHILQYLKITTSLLGEKIL